MTERKTPPGIADWQQKDNGGSKMVCWCQERHIWCMGKYVWIDWLISILYNYNLYDAYFC